MKEKVSQDNKINPEEELQDNVVKDSETELQELKQQLQQQQQLIQQLTPPQPPSPQRRVKLGGKSSKELKVLSYLLEDIQDQLEPIRDKALDEKMRLIGYCQCAEYFIKIIVDRSESIKQRAIEHAKTEREEEMSALREKAKSVKEAPKAKSRKKKNKEE
jgi:hypothetical protein